MADPEIAERLRRFLAHRSGDEDARVWNFARVMGGGSQECYRLSASWQDEGTAKERELILRRAPESGLVNAEADLEYRVYAGLEGCELPVPKVYFFEDDPAWLDRPFLLIDCMPGIAGDKLIAQGIEERQVRILGQSFWEAFGKLARIDPSARPFPGLRNFGRAGGFANRELDYWEAILDEGEEVIEPIPRAAIRWLRRNLPAEPARAALSHGDFRIVNLLFQPDCSVGAILDWEMCHISDPLEDIAWAINPMWTAESTLPLAEGLAIWEANSGLSVDHDALEWWRLFVAVKCCAIWTTAEASIQNGTNREAGLALTGLRAPSIHRQEIIQRLARLDSSR